MIWGKESNIIDFHFLFKFEEVDSSRNKFVAPAILAIRVIALLESLSILLSLLLITVTMKTYIEIYLNRMEICNSYFGYSCYC